ncbi:MAG: alcohol dehydrogenase catalytic domain-containing protein [Planctomycetota bacterium]
MKAFALVAPGTFDWAEIPDEPPPGPGEVVVRPTACGVCASDVHYWKRGNIGSQVVTDYPYAVGHECAAVVAEVGEGVTNVAPGDRVAVEPGIPCGACRPCRDGRPNICPNVRFLGTPPIQGAMRETLLTVAENVEPIPGDLDFAAAALCEPLGVGIHAARLADVQPGETVAIFGAGPIGFSTAVACRCRGADRVLIAEPVPERRRLAEKLGFEPLDIEPDPVARIRELTGGGADAAFEAAGDLRAMDWTVRSPRLGARACIIGIPAEDAVPFPVDIIRRAELTLYNCRRSNRTLPDAVRTIAGPGKDLRRICTHTFPLDEAQRAFQMSANREDGVVKAMLEFD